MDLRSIINNTEAGEASSSSSSSSGPKQSATPVTPIQTGPPQQGFGRDYSQPPHASPGKHPSHDYGPPSQPGPGPYASPTSYQNQAPYTRPPPPPPIQAPPQSDLRSPAGSFTSQSPYRQTPTSGMSNPQYPFAQNHQTPQSPAQHQQFPPSYIPRDSYSQSNGPPHPQHQGRGSPAPQTPPIGIPGQTHPYLQHQRSQSSVSTSTPTSAQSQQHYFNQYPQDSPVSAGQFPPSQLPQHQRQQSQPGTPLGPPLRQSSGGFTQPTSPYQQRGLPPGPFSQFQTSPAPPPPATIPRLPSTPRSGYDSQRTSTSEPNRRSQSERERSLSVSPKTRLPSQPRGDVSIMQQHPENGYNMSNMSVKRKMEDREMPIEEPRRINQPEIKPQVNGNNRIPSISSNASPKQPPKKRTRYTEPPIWAQSVKGRKTVLGAANNRINPKVNGKQPAPLPQSAPPPSIRSETNGHRPITPNGPIDDPSIMLGAWERSITNKKPQEQITKVVADWLYYNVVSRDDFGELASRGVEVEIEAKLGQLVDRETNHRYELPVQTECVLRDTGRIIFRSSMTESQHKSLNDFLNGKVQETHPSNPQAQSQGRIPIEYRHRRETDKFFELPAAYNGTLPPALRAQLNPRHAVKVRVSYDQKTGGVLAKIIKARIADLDIYNPASPLDCRISINFEMRFDGDLADLKANVSDQQAPDRNKDRLSYSQSHYQIDLTQVTQLSSTNGVNRTEKEHELEIEVSTAALRDQGQRALAGQPNEYLSLVEGFLDNMRILAKAVPPH